MTQQKSNLYSNSYIIWAKALIWNFDEHTMIQKYSIYLHEEPLPFTITQKIENLILWLSPLQNDKGTKMVTHTPYIMDQDTTRLRVLIVELVMR